MLYLTWRLAGVRAPGSRTPDRPVRRDAPRPPCSPCGRRRSPSRSPSPWRSPRILFFPPAGIRRWLSIVPVGLVALLIPATWIDFRGPVATVSGAPTRRPGSSRLVSRLDYLRTQAVVVCEYLRLARLADRPEPRPRLPDLHVMARAPRDSGSEPRSGSLWWRSPSGSTRRTGPRRPAPPLDPAFRIVSFGIGWFFLALSVESSVIPIVDVIYEHRAYLPSVGLFVASATLLVGALRAGRIARVQGGRRCSPVSRSSLVLGSSTLQRNAVWASAVTLWSDTAAKSPRKRRPHLNLGESLDAVRRPRGCRA